MIIKKLSIFIVVLSILNCQSTAKKIISDKSDSTGGKAILITKIIVTPEIGSDEQLLPLTFEEMHRLNCLAFYSDKPDDIQEFKKIPPSIWGNYLKLKLNTQLYIQSGHESFYLGSIYTKMDYHEERTGPESVTIYDINMYMPGVYSVNIKEEDEAVYIGTIYATRDDNNKIVSLKIIDDFNQNEFKEKFPDLKIRKSLLQKVI